LGRLVSICEIIRRIKYLKNADRIGIDNPITHWRLHVKSLGVSLCKQKFKNFGDDSEFRPGAFAIGCSKISIGSNVTIRPGTFLHADDRPGGGEIIIEDKVLIGPSVHIYTNNHIFTNPNTPIYDQGYPVPKISDSVIIRTGAWLGANVIILPGVEIGKNSVIAAGSVITKSVPAYSLCVGNPGKVIHNLIN
jgi:acetyltransferase-like isoleucine patch superfamily enzyme